MSDDDVHVHVESLGQPLPGGHCNRILDQSAIAAALPSRRYPPVGNHAPRLRERARPPQTGDVIVFESDQVLKGR